MAPECWHDRWIEDLWVWRVLREGLASNARSLCRIEYGVVRAWIWEKVGKETEEGKDKRSEEECRGER